MICSVVLCQFVSFFKLYCRSDVRLLASTSNLCFSLLFFFFCSYCISVFFFFFSSRRRYTRSTRDWSSDVCSSDLEFAKGSAKYLGGVATGMLIANRQQLLSLFLGLRDYLGASNTRRWSTLLVSGTAFLLWLLFARSEERRVGKECRFCCCLVF